MSEFLELTDRYGAAVAIRRSEIVLIYGDCIIVPTHDCQGQQSRFGTTIVMCNGATTIFVTEPPETVIDCLRVPE